jgi:S-adenosylmethionine-diacylglycerol 3-amino-3-carboxypropyl transferase
MAAAALSGACSPMGRMVMGSEVAARADFSRIRYAQCWEDADILVEALQLHQGGRCLSIASAGDNALALLGAGAEYVVALDMNPAQLACLALRVAAYRELSHGELLELIGSRPSSRRRDLYRRCRSQLDSGTRAFWDNRRDEIDAGIGGAGKFERYFSLFRNRVLPLVHGRPLVERLLRGGDRATREAFYRNHWDSWRWRLLFKLFFSRFVMGRMGRDPSFFRYVEGGVAEHVLKHTRYALTELNPADNPYLNWILTGSHATALPYALRQENFEAIRERIERVEWHLLSIEDYLVRFPDERFDAFNLSDIFEYMSEDNYQALLTRMIAVANPGARLAYWNMLAPRKCPASLSGRLHSLDDIAGRLYARDKAFFYRDFIVEEVR